MVASGAATTSGGMNISLAAKERQTRVLPFIVVSILLSPRFQLNCNIVHSAADNPRGTGITLKSILE